MISKSYINTPPPFKIVIMKPNREVVGFISKNIIQPNLSLKLGGLHELTFSLPKYLVKHDKQILNPAIGYMKANYQFEVSYGQYKDLFIIDKFDKSADGSNDTYAVTLKLYPSSLLKRDISEWLGIYKDYKPTDPDEE